MLERMYLAEYFGGDTHHAITQLRGLAVRAGLSDSAVRLIVEDALRRTVHDRIRLLVWELLVALDSGTG